MITYKEVDIYDDQVADLVFELTKYLKMEAKKEHIAKSLQALFLSDMFFCIGAYEGEKLIGTLGVMIFPELYNFNRKLGSEQFWYVLPGYRKGVGIELLKYLENNFKMDQLEFGTHDKRLQKLLERRGFIEEKTIIKKEY